MVRAIYRSFYNWPLSVVDINFPRVWRFCFKTKIKLLNTFANSTRLQADLSHKVHSLVTTIQIIISTRKSWVQFHGLLFCRWHRRVFRTTLWHESDHSRGVGRFHFPCHLQTVSSTDEKKGPIHHLSEGFGYITYCHSWIRVPTYLFKFLPWQDNDCCWPL